MAKPAENDYPELDLLTKTGAPSVRIEAALALTEIDKWRRQDEEDEKAWRDAGPED